MSARMPRPAVAAAALLLVFLAGCTVRTGDGEDAGDATDRAAHEVPLQVVQRGDRTLALVRVTIGGHGPLRFVLDTGASSSSVDRGVAERIGLERTGRSVTVSGIVETTTVPVVRVPRWEVGAVQLPPTRMAVLDLGVPRNDQEIHGLLGSDVLDDYARIGIDYDEEELTLYER